MTMFTLNKNPSRKELNQFAWSMLGGFGVIAVLLWLVPPWRSGDMAGLSWSGSRAQVTAIVLVALGAVLFVLTKFPSPAARPVYVVWMAVVMRIGIVMSTVLLTLLFLVLLPLFSLIVRLGDPLRKKLHAGATYWEDYKPYDPTVERMRRPF